LVYKFLYLHHLLSYFRLSLLCMYMISCLLSTMKLNEYVMLCYVMNIRNIILHFDTVGRAPLTFCPIAPMSKGPIWSLLETGSNLKGLAVGEWPSRSPTIVVNCAIRYAITSHFVICRGLFTRLTTIWRVTLELHINWLKSKIQQIDGKPRYNQWHLTVAGENVEIVESFVCLGSLMDRREDATSKSVTRSCMTTRQAYL